MAVAIRQDTYIGGEWLPEGANFYCSGEFVIPADEDELDALARRWEREIARGVGIAAWEP